MVKELLAVLLCYNVGVTAFVQFFRKLQNLKADDWMKACSESELGVSSKSLVDEAKDFWKTADSNYLMHLYYRGMPSQFLGAFLKRENFEATLRDQKTTWMLDLLEEARQKNAQLLKSITMKERDVKRCHRLQVFPVLIAAQCIPHADMETRRGICSFIGGILNATQVGGSEYTDSARDQINQIIPQVLTDQLLTGPIAWNNFMVSKPVVERLISLCADPDVAKRFETASGLAAQFLAYYQISLDFPDKKSRVRYECEEHANLIERAFCSIDKIHGSLPLTLNNWCSRLRDHAREARNHPVPYRFLMRQRSAALIAHHCETHRMPPDLWDMSVFNALRDAHCSLEGPDAEDRIQRIVTFLSTNGVTSHDALRILNAYSGNANSSLYTSAKDFVVDRLPNKPIPPTPDSALLSSAHGHTLDALWFDLSNYRTWHKWERRGAILPHHEKYLQVIEKGIWPIAQVAYRLWAGGKHARIEDLRQLINRLIRSQGF